MNVDRELLRQFQSSESKNEKFALATIVRVKGSSYRKVGAKMLITETGRISGMISGGCLERDVIRRSQIALSTGNGQLVCYDTRLDFKEEDHDERTTEAPSLGCEGLIEIYINPSPREHLKALQETHTEFKNKEVTLTLPDGSVFTDILRPRVRLIIFGAGPDAFAMGRMGHEVGWHTTLLDCRSSFPFSPSEWSWTPDHYQVCNLNELRLHIPESPDFVAILMTHNYDHDLHILQLLNRIQPLYAGVLGPRARTLRMINELARSGVLINPAQFHFPMGLDIGGDTPQAVALSTIAEVQAVLSNRQGGSLRFRMGSIHDELPDHDEAIESKSRRQLSLAMTT